MNKVDLNISNVLEVKKKDNMQIMKQICEELEHL